MNWDDRTIQRNEKAHPARRVACGSLTDKPSRAEIQLCPLLSDFVAEVGDWKTAPDFG